MPFTKKMTKILIVDDDEDDFFITSDYIREIENAQFEIEWANNFNSTMSH